MGEAVENMEEDLLSLTMRDLGESSRNPSL